MAGVRGTNQTFKQIHASTPTENIAFAIVRIDMLKL